MVAVAITPVLPVMDTFTRLTRNDEKDDWLKRGVRSDAAGAVPSAGFTSRWRTIGGRDWRLLPGSEGAYRFRVDAPRRTDGHSFVLIW